VQGCGSAFRGGPYFFGRKRGGSLPCGIQLGGETPSWIRRNLLLERSAVKNITFTRKKGPATASVAGAKKHMLKGASAREERKNCTNIAVERGNEWRKKKKKKMSGTAYQGWI